MKRQTDIAETLPAEVAAEIREAKALLESPGLVVRLNDALGGRIEQAGQMLPEDWQRRIQGAAKFSLDTAVKTAAKSIRGESDKSSKRLHQLIVGSAGAVGGATGLAGVAIELPITVTMMLRSILDIARSNGENLDDPETLLAALEVFAMGGHSSNDDDAELGYIALRAEMGWLVSQGVEQAVKTAAGRELGTAISAMVARVAPRFGVSVSQKAMAQAMPVLGAIGGASINLLFINHFQSMAEGHFSLRRLEREYGRDLVWSAYKALPAPDATPLD